MDGKKRGDKCTAPHSVCHLFQDEEEKENCDRMQEDVTEMIAAGAHAKELCVQHEGN